MLQYLLNATAIWLLSLLVFEALLRRQSYHNYNRAYLLLTFAAGLVIPLMQWRGGAAGAHALLMQPAAQLAAAGQTITAAAPAAAGYRLPWLSILYITGAVCALGLLLADVAKLVMLYRHGKKQADGGWTTIETHKEHAPFSLRNMLFVSSRRLYSTEEWAMLLMHEGQHSKLLHFADLTFIQLARVCLWFHPLVYVYHRRMALVHEYQADSAASQQPKVYGRFLIEQCMLQAAPGIAHALSNAPVKDRIIMLTHRSGRYRQFTKLLVFPLIALFMICFTRYDIEYQMGKNEQHNNLAVQTPYEVPASLSNTALAIVNEQAQQAAMPAKEYRKPVAKENRLSPSAPTNSCYRPANSDVILLAGMENNANAKCCSSNLLWGNDYSKVTLTEGYPKYAAVYLPATTANVNGNPCTQGFDRYRKEQYTHAVAYYSHILSSWSEYSGDNITELAATTNSAPMQLVITDDPWSLNTDKRPITAPVLNVDRSVFGQSTRTIFDGAMALAKQNKVSSIHTKNISFNP